MNILMASTPATGHINPILAIGRILKDDGHDLTILTGSWLRERVERVGARFRPFPGNADLDLRDIGSFAPDLAKMPPGLDWMRVAIERFCVDRIVDQHAGLQQAMRASAPDVIIGDNTLFGLLPILLGPSAERPPVVLCGTSFLHWCRSDGAPHFFGLPPATRPEDLSRYAAIADDFERLVNGPATRRVNEHLRAFRRPPITLPFFDSMVAYPDIYLQLTVPSFEFPRTTPPGVRFVGTPPIMPNQVPLPPWAGELDGARRVVLVTQGTVANDDLGRLVAPTLAALANDPDILVVATAGGRPLEAIPGPIPANARLASYLPFEWLLPKVDALVTNGGYGSVNQALSAGVPLVTAGLTEDKADVNARVAWAGVGIDLATNQPDPEAVRDAVRIVLDTAPYRDRARTMSGEFRAIDTPAEVRRIVRQLVADRVFSHPRPKSRDLSPAQTLARAR